MGGTGRALGGRKVSVAIRVPHDDVVNLTHVIGNFALPASIDLGVRASGASARILDLVTESRIRIPATIQFCLRGSSAGFT